MGTPVVVKLVHIDGEKSTSGFFEFPENKVPLHNTARRVPTFFVDDLDRKGEPTVLIGHKFRFSTLPDMADGTRVFLLLDIN